MVNKLKIAFIVGKNTDFTYINKKLMKLNSYKLAPKWFKEGIKKFKDFAVEDKDEPEDHNSIPSDVGIAAYINYHYSDKCEVSLFDGCDVGDEWNLKDMNKQDIIFVIFGINEILNECDDDLNKIKLFKRIMKKTSAFVCPNNDFYDYINYKIDYYKDLKKANIPVVRSESFNIKNIKTLDDAKKFKEKLLKFNTKIIAKPALGAYSFGVKIFKNLNVTKTSSILNYIKKLQKKGYFKLIIQDFVNSFASNYEVRTYWINQGSSYKYLYSFASKLDIKKGEWDKFDTFKSENGSIDNKILERMKKIAKKVLKLNKVKKNPLPFLRIDLGCCLQDNEYDSPKLEEQGRIFVNEIEVIGANILTKKTDKDIIKIMGETFYKYAKKYAK